MSRVQLEKKSTMQLVSELQTVLKPYICMSIASLDRMWQQVKHARRLMLVGVRELFDEIQSSVKAVCRIWVSLAIQNIQYRQEKV